MPFNIRARAVFLAAALATLVAGLTVHRYGEALPSAVRDIAGDALWAAMIFWGVSMLAPRTFLWTRAAVSYLICTLVETSQRVHTPLLDQFRHTTIGHLVLGSDFDARDFAAYALGILVALFIEHTVRRDTVV